METSPTTTLRGQHVRPDPAGGSPSAPSARSAWSLSGSAIGSVPQPAGDKWWFTVPVGTGLGAHLGLLRLGRRPPGRLGRESASTPTGAACRSAPSWLILGLWGLPFFLGAPLFSRDLYSYVAQGHLADHGLNPYVVAPAALGPRQPPLLDRLGVAAHGLPVRPTLRGRQPRRSIRIRIIAGARRSWCSGPSSWSVSVLLMVSLPVLARRLGNDPGLALWLAVLSPLALFSFVSSGHNDALMLGLMLAGITIGIGGRLRWGIALCAPGRHHQTSGRGRHRVPGGRRVHPCRPVGPVADHRRGDGHPGAGGGRGDRGRRPRVDVARADGAPRPDRAAGADHPARLLGTFIYGILHAIGLPVTQSATGVGGPGRRRRRRGQRHPVDALPHPQRRCGPTVRPGPDPVRGAAARRCGPGT